MPDVPKTLSRYLSAVKSFVADADFQRTEVLVRNFVENKEDVAAIEKSLRERAQREENWVSGSIGQSSIVFFVAL